MEGFALALVVALIVAIVAWGYQKLMYQKCPECRSLVAITARRCKHCGENL